MTKTRIQATRHVIQQVIIQDIQDRYTYFTIYKTAYVCFEYIWGTFNLVGKNLYEP